MTMIRSVIACLLTLSVVAVPALAEEARKPAPLEAVFDQPRSDEEDVIYLRYKGVLLGTVLNETLGINTPYGNVDVALRKCAGVSFEGSRANTEVLVTVNRNRLTGIITDRVIRFRVGSSGEELDIRKEKIQFILLRRSSKELDFVDGKQPADLFVMTNGDLLTGKPTEPRITVTTDHGSVPVGFDAIRKIEMQGGRNVTAVITKDNKDVMRGTLDTEEITIRLELGVTVDRVYKDKFAKLFIEHVPDEMSAHFGVGPPAGGESDGALTTAPLPGNRPRETNRDRPPTLEARRHAAPVYSSWPLDAREARRWQKATSDALGIPVERTLDLGDGVTMEFVLIPAGVFLMGSTPDEAGHHGDEGPLRLVRITPPFYMGQHEVTQAQWQAVMGTNWSRFKGDDRRPVERVAWNDCQEFCRKLTQRLSDGRTVRLPSEAEWEYACRAGSPAAYSFGNDRSRLGTYAWYEGNSDMKTHPVGRKRPNAWGLYDMHGNVWEWCADAYHHSYDGAPTDGKARTGSDMDCPVIRGGSWNDSPRSLRAAGRAWIWPDATDGNGGLRVVLVVGGSAGTQ